MSTIMIIGNIVKDVYLNIDSRVEKLEEDADGIQWMNLGFNTNGHKYFRRFPCLGGAAISLEIFHNMGVESSISGSNIDFDGDGVTQDGGNSAIYRYILVCDEQATYFSPSFEVMPKFVAPEVAPDYIFIDRSVKLFPTDEILNYLEKNPSTKLAIHVGKILRSEDEDKLIKAADLVFAERRMSGVDADKLFNIRDSYISHLDEKIDLKIPKLELTTHLSALSIVAATILGALASDENASDAMALAKTNVEHSSIDKTLSLKRMRKIMEEEREINQAIIDASNLKK